MLSFLRNPAKAFRAVMAREAAAETRLGNPSPDEAARLRRQNTMALLTGGRGFRVPPQEPRVRADGKTRGQMRRERYAQLFLGASS